jgi:hypothetical protein
MIEFLKERQRRQIYNKNKSLFHGSHQKSGQKDIVFYNLTRVQSSNCQIIITFKYSLNLY